MVEGWHAPAGRRTREPRPLAQARQIRPAAPAGTRNWDPAGKPVAGQPQRRRPDRRSGRVPGSDATPGPPQNPGSKMACRNRSPHPPCRPCAACLRRVRPAPVAQNRQFCSSGRPEGSPGAWVRSTDPPGQGPGVRQAQRQALPSLFRDGLTDAGYHRSARLDRQLGAACDDFQYLVADRAAARPDDIPVRGEGPPRLRVRRENAGLGAQQGSCRDRFEAKFHPGLDPSRFGPGTQGRRVQIRRYRSAQQAPGLAEAR